MVSLKSTASRFSSEFVTEQGYPFVGTFFPAGEGEVPNYVFSLPRKLLRVDPDTELVAGQMFIDDFSDCYLIAEFDANALQGTKLYRVFQVFKMTETYPWSRSITENDPLTGLARKTSDGPLGTIRCAMDVAGREYPDRSINAREEQLKIITGSDLQLNDKVDGKIVKIVNRLLGVTVATIQ